MIKVDAVSRTYGKVVAVNNVSFEIGPTEIVGLLGQNGAGKTTILKMLTGFLEPSSGKILINGLDVCEDRKRIQADIGYLPENSPLYPEMTVLEYLDYAADLHGVAPEKKQERLVNAIQKTRLADVALSQISTLSRGYKQRVGVAQSILSSPGILILDEPTNGLDPSQILEMRALIRELSQSATVIISTHILQEVQALCGRVIIINKGHLALDAKLDTLQSSDRLVVEVNGELEKYSVLEKLGLEVLGRQQLDGHNRYTLKAGTGKTSELIPPLIRAITAEGLDIYSVHPIGRDLETVFREIIAGEAAVSFEQNSAAALSSSSEESQDGSGEKEAVLASGKEGDSSEAP